MSGVLENRHTSQIICNRCLLKMYISLKSNMSAIIFSEFFFILVRKNATYCDDMFKSFIIEQSIQYKESVEEGLYTPKAWAVIKDLCGVKLESQRSPQFTPEKFRQYQYLRETYMHSNALHKGMVKVWRTNTMLSPTVSNVLSPFELIV